MPPGTNDLVEQRALVGMFELAPAAANARGGSIFDSEELRLE